MLKDILVYLNGGPEDQVRLAHAKALAAAHKAHLTGLYCNIVPDVFLAGDSSMTGSQLILDLQESARVEGDGIEKRLEAEFAQIDLPTTLMRRDLYAGQAGQVIATEARLYDLFVATRPHDRPATDPSIIEAALFGSGRGCLFVPPKTVPDAPIERVIIAWRGTKEAARAVAEAMPLLRAAKHVAVVMVEDDTLEDKRGKPGADIVRHLSRHGVTAETRVLTGWGSVEEALLNEIKTAEAQVLVMGGYGHSRLREWILGGATRAVLRAAPIPVLVAH